jgi:hypothetical protein
MKLAIIVGAMILVFTSAAFAESIMCENGTASTDDNMAMVLDKCGMPLYKTKENPATGTRKETWTYKIGGCYREFYFESGILKEIRDKSLSK